MDAIVEGIYADGILYTMGICGCYKYDIMGCNAYGKCS